MKNLKPILLCALIALSVNLKAQTSQDVLSDKNIPIIFYGIDFTKSLLIGDANAKKGDIVARQFTGINDLMIKESDKYNFAGAFNRKELPANLEFVKKRNEAIDSNKIVSSNTEDFNHLKEGDVGNLVKNFKTDGSAGYGLLLVVDAMSKPDARISGWIVLFDNKTKRILLNERHEGKVGMAFSFRNYWAAGIKNIISSIAGKNKKR